MENATSRVPTGRALALAGAVLVLDQATKEAVRRSLSLHDETVLLPGLLSLRHGGNPGLAFGVLGDTPLPFQAALLSLVAVVLVGALLAFWGTIATTKRAEAALALILGGALGNLIDRVRLGAVTDFVHVHWRAWSWPDFNVADSAICVAVGLLLMDAMRSTPAPVGPPPPPAPHADDLR